MIDAVSINKRHEAIKATGLLPIEWMVMEDMDRHLIIRHRITGEIRVIDK